MSFTHDTLFVAATRPAMKFGVPYEGFMLNVGIVTFGGMFAGSPLWWALGVPVHFVMRFQAARNPGFFRELRMWFETKGANAGGRLWALPDRPARKGEELPSAI